MRSSGSSQDPKADVGGEAAVDAFAGEVRRFLSDALTEDLRAAGRDTVGVHSDIGACRLWHGRLHARGWIAPAWPREHGGAGWTAEQRFLFDRECALNDAPVLFAGGLRNVGPLLIAVGTERQRRAYLPSILDGSDLWCQGFSEPGAGSDLAGLQTRAEARHDHYVVNGSKIWTTGAHIANRMFLLVRTATGARPQDGITFLLVDMASPGIRVRPIRTIAGDPEFCEVFFDGLRVPIEDRVGAENDGWAVAKMLMRFARASNTTTGLLRRSFRRAEHIFANHASNDEALTLKLRAIECELRAFEALEVSLHRAASPDGPAEMQASMLKTLATELHQRITGVALDAAGPIACALPADLADRHLPDGSFATRKYLATRAASIYSGTNETHRNLIARGLARF